MRAAVGGGPLDGTGGIELTPIRGVGGGGPPALGNIPGGISTLAIVAGGAPIVGGGAPCPPATGTTPGGMSTDAIVTVPYI